MPTSSASFQTGLSEVPVTIERSPYDPTPSQNERLPNPGTARANIAASLDAPNGTQTNDWAARHAHRTVLQQHVDFFDENGDGAITPLETYRGFRALGFGFLFSLLSAIGIHLGLSYPTVDGWLPDLLFRIYPKNIHKGKHGSDSGTLDNEGRFIPQKFEDFFAKYSSTPGKDGLTKADVWKGLAGQRVFADPAGSIAGLTEWLSLWMMLSPPDGVLKKDDVRRVYDGSLFAEVKARNARPTKPKSM